MYGYYEMYRDNADQAEIFLSKDNTCLPHFHGLIELTYVVTGEIIANINGNIFTVPKNSLSIASSYDVHSFSSPTPSSSYVLQIPTRFINKSIAQNGISFNESVMADNQQLELLHAFDMTFYHCNAKSDVNIIKSYINVILSLLVHTVGTNQQSRHVQSQSIQDILLYISENYAKELKLEDLSKRFGYSKYYFSKFFNLHFGCTINDYINTIRVRNAARLLKETEMSPTDIAFECGFGSVRSFYRSFKEIYRVSPCRYSSISEI